MTLPCIVRLALGAFGGLSLGVAIGLWKVRALRAEVTTWRALATDLHAENSQLRLETLGLDRGQP